MTEKTDLGGEMEESLGCIELAEDVMIFIEWSAMTDGYVIIDLQRALFKSLEITAVFLQQIFFCPVNGRSSDRVKSLHAFEVADSLVMVSSDYRQRFHELYFLDDFICGCPIANQISEKYEVIDFALTGKFYDRKKGLQVAVDVCEDKISHWFSLSFCGQTLEQCVSAVGTPHQWPGDDGLKTEREGEF